MVLNVKYLNNRDAARLGAIYQRLLSVQRGWHVPVPPIGPAATGFLNIDDKQRGVVSGYFASPEAGGIRREYTIPHGAARHRTRRTLSPCELEFSLTRADRAVCHDSGG